MSNKFDLDAALIETLKTTNEELDNSRGFIETLANDLSSVIEIIEPVLEKHTTRLRSARMASLAEIQTITTQVKTLRELLLAPQTEQAIVKAERFLAVCREIEEFRACGFLDAFIESLAPLHTEERPA